MKKIIGLSIAFVLISTISWANVITFDTATVNSDITRKWLNETYGKVYAVVNGGLDTTNLASGAVTADDITTNANPLIRDNELIGEMVYSGLAIATSATLTSTITAGVAYVEQDAENKLYRVVTEDTSKTFTASKDTWVYLTYTGAFSYNAQSLGAAQPTTPDNSILIAKVVTDGTTVASVVDYRQDSPTNLRIYTYYKNGLVISRDTTTATTMTIGPGEIEFGADNGGVRANTSNTSISFTTTGTGGLDAGSLAANTYYYIYAIADTDNETNFEGIASLSSSDATGVTGERLVGWCFANTASNISPDGFGAYRKFGGDAPSYYSFKKHGVAYALGNAKATKSLQAAKVYTSGRPLLISYSISGYHSSGWISVVGSISVDSKADNNTIQYGDFYEVTYKSGLSKTFILNRVAAGVHTIELKACDPAGGTATVTNYSLTIEEL